MSGEYVIGQPPPEGWERYLRQVLDRLCGTFGPRHWWPAAGAPAPAKAEPFEMIVGAILVQNVAWSNTEKALLALKAAGLLAPRAMATVEAEALEPLIRPAGYYRQKSLKLKRFVQHLDERHGGDLAAMLAQPLADLRAELLAINGIGPETCDCILNYAAGKPVMAMDAYTRRIFSRLGIFDPRIGYAQMQVFFHGHLPADVDLLGEYHAQIDTLGHRICLKSRPACVQCPLASLCPRQGVEETGAAGRSPAPWAQSGGE